MSSPDTKAKAEEDGLPFKPHPTDPDGVVLPPPTEKQLSDKERVQYKVYYREEWGGRQPKEVRTMYIPVHKVVLSRTETEPCLTHEECKARIQEMQNAHMDEEGEPDIKYHFLVGGDGALYEGRGFTTVGRSYPVTKNNFQDLSKSCLEIAFIQKSDTETTELMQKIAWHCLSLAVSANFVYKKFDLYFVANNDIAYKQEVRETSIAGLFKDKDSLDGKSQTDTATGNERDETVETKWEEEGTTVHATESHVPRHDPPGDDNAEDAKKEVVPVNFIYRHDWGAKRPKWIKALNIPINKVAVSYTESDPCHTQEECIQAVRKLQDEHLQEEKEPDIKHNFLIGGDGQIYEGRGYTREGPIYPPSARKIEELVGKSIDIGIIDKNAKPASNETIRAISWVMSSGVNQKYIEMNFETYYIANDEIIHIQRPVNEATPKDP